mgnify:CR=1 FL=1
MDINIKDINQEFLWQLYESIKDSTGINISKEILLPFPEPSELQLIKNFIDITIHKSKSDSINVKVNRIHLHYLILYLSNDKVDWELKDFWNEIIESIPYVILNKSFNQIEEFIKYDYSILYNSKIHLCLPMYALLKVNMKYKFQDNTEIIWYEQITWDCAWYEWMDIEISNYRSHLLESLHYNIMQNSHYKWLDDYDRCLVKYKNFINKNFSIEWDLESYITNKQINIKLNVNISIYDGIIRDNSKEIIKLTKTEKIILDILKSQMKSWGISADNLQRKVNSTSISALRESIKRLRKKIKNNSYDRYIKIIYSKWTNTYKLTINN